MFEVTNFLGEIKRIDEEKLYQRTTYKKINKLVDTEPVGPELISFGCCIKNVNNAFVTVW